MATLMKAEVRFFADLVTLTFHEARNVRHLVRAGELEKPQFRMLSMHFPLVGTTLGENFCPSE
jgi:hypothetical protein